MLRTMQQLGGLASRRQLGLLGFGRHVVDVQVRAGALLPVRPGWLATPGANRLAVAAVLRGARLTAHTALRSYDVWNATDLRTHEQVRPNSAPVAQRPLTPLSRFQAPRFREDGVVRHWARFSATPAGEPAWRVSLLDALVRFARCETDEQVVAAIESAVHTGRLRRADLPALFSLLPRRLEHLPARLTFLADSGLESIARWRLERLRMRIEQQVTIGRDTVDLVVEHWLIVELDGDEFHDQVADRIRTNRLIRAGYRVLRFGQAEVLRHWDATLATILEMLRTGAPHATQRSRSISGSRRRSSSISR